MGIGSDKPGQCRNCNTVRSATVHTGSGAANVFRAIQDERFQTRRADDECLKRIQKLGTKISVSGWNCRMVASSTRDSRPTPGGIGWHCNQKPSKKPRSPTRFVQGGRASWPTKFIEEGWVRWPATLPSGGRARSPARFVEEKLYEDLLEVEDGRRGGKSKVKGLLQGRLEEAGSMDLDRGEGQRSQSKVDSGGVHDKSLGVMALTLQSMQKMMEDREDRMESIRHSVLDLPSSLNGLEMGRPTWEICWFCLSPSCPIFPQIRNFGGNPYSRVSSMVF